MKKNTILGRGYAEPGYMAALLLALVVVNLAWLFKDQLPFAWDESIHYMGAVGYFQALKAGGHHLFSKILYLSDFYPPLMEFLGGVIFLVTQPSPDVASFINVFFIMGICVLLYTMGQKYFGKETGVLAAYFFAASSAIVIQSKVFMLDIPLAFFVTLGYYAFLNSERFLSKRWSALYGVVLGLAMLTKWSALFFLAMPPVVMVAIEMVRNPKARKTLLLNLLLVYGITALMAAPWYLVHFIKLVKNTTGYVYARGVLENDPPLLSPWAWFYYLGSVFRQTSIPMALALLTGLGVYFWQRKRLVWLSLWLGVPYLILMLIRNKDHRYIIPLLPLLCLAGVSWIQTLNPKLRQRVLLGVVLACLGQLAYVHLGPQTGWLYQLTQTQILDTPLVNSCAPQPHEWPLGAILAEVEKQSSTLSRQPVLRVIPDYASFSRVTFAVEQSKRKPKVMLSSTSNWPMFTDLAVTKTGSLGLDFNVDLPKKISRALQIETHAERPRFEVLQTYDLPDRSQAILYARREVLSELPPDKVIDLLKAQLNELVSAFVAEAKTYQIDIEPYSDQETRLGRFKRIHIYALQGHVGDFKHKAFGVPFEKLDADLWDIILDVEQLDFGKLVIYSLGGLHLNEVELKAETLNQAVSQAEDDIRSLRISCQDNILTANWLGLVPAQVRVALQVIPDRDQPTSSNLRFDLLSLRIAWLPIPGWLLQPLLEDFNPLFKLAGFPGDITLGAIRIDQGEIRMGTEVKRK